MLDAECTIKGDDHALEQRLARALSDVHLWQERYRAISESIPHGIWICDAAGQLIYCSHAILDLLGMTFEQVAGARWYDTLHPDDVAETERAWQDCVRTGQNWVRLHRYRGKDGEYHPVLARGRPLRDKGDSIREWVGVNFDVADLIGVYENFKAKGHCLDITEPCGRLRDERSLPARPRYADIALYDCWRVPGSFGCEGIYLLRMSSEVRDLLIPLVSETNPRKRECNGT